MKKFLIDLAHFFIIPSLPQQVDEWYPELIEIEEQAKSDASLLLFVVDNQTRAVSSMVEIAYFAGEFVKKNFLCHAQFFC